VIQDISMTLARVTLDDVVNRLELGIRNRVITVFTGPICSTKTKRVFRFWTNFAVLTCTACISAGHRAELRAVRCV